MSVDEQTQRMITRLDSIIHILERDKPIEEIQSITHIRTFSIFKGILEKEFPHV